MIKKIGAAKMGKPVLFVTVLAVSTLAALFYSFLQPAKAASRMTAAPAKVLSLKLYRGIPDVSAPSAKIDVLSMVLANSSHSYSVKVTVYGCLAHAVNDVPTVLKVSDSGKYFPKPNAEWTFRLSPGKMEKVIFNIRNTYYTQYCTANVVKGVAHITGQSN